MKAFHLDGSCAFTSASKGNAKDSDPNGNDDEGLHNVTRNERTPAADAEEAYADLAFNLEERIRQHDELRDRGDFQAEQKRLNRHYGGP